MTRSGSWPPAHAWNWRSNTNGYATTHPAILIDGNAGEIALRSCLSWRKSNLKLSLPAHLNDTTCGEDDDVVHGDVDGDVGATAGHIGDMAPVLDLPGDTTFPAMLNARSHRNPVRRMSKLIQ